MATSERVRTRRWARVSFAGAATLVGATTWLVLDGRSAWAGAAAAGAGALSTAGSTLSRSRGGAPERLLDSGVDRAFDGCVLSAIAWSTIGPDPATSAGALIALAVGFLAAYVRARGESLGYRIDESLVGRSLRYAVLSLGLATGWLRGAVFTVAALSTAAALVRASQVVKEERA